MRTLPCLALLLALPALADSPDWKEIMKEQAGQHMEKELNLPQPAPAGARAYLIEPKDGAEVTSPVKVVFGLSGMGVAPAGVNNPATGHHHLLIDEPAINYAQPLPSSDRIQHFGGGQTETSVVLAPGQHTLQLLVGDWKHQPNNPAVQSEKVTITVK